MRCSTAGRTRLPGTLLVVVLLAGSLVLGPSPVSAGESDPVGVWPLSPAPDVAARFDPPDAPWAAGHRGVDLRGRVGQTVRSALRGRVTFAGVLAGRGVVVVNHGSTRTTYEPVAAGVRVGDTVAEGAPLGRLTTMSSHCLPAVCLHWGWVRNADGAYLDPLGLLGPGAVRLLPLWRARPAEQRGPLAMSPAPASAPASAYAGWRPPLHLLRFRGGF